MEFVFVCGIISFMYLLTVNRRNAKEIKNLKNQVFGLEQTFEMILKYGKAEAKKRFEKEETFEEERFLDQQHPE